MALKILKPTRRFSWPFILSVGLHTSLVAGLLYASVTEIVSPPAGEPPMSVTLVAPEPEQAAPAEQPVVEPEPEAIPPEPEVVPETPAPEPLPEPEPEPPAPVQQPKPKPKPVPKKAVVKPRPKPATPVERPRADPQERSDTPAATASVSRAPQATPSQKAAPGGPKALSRANPAYSSRAQALRIEGKVRVQFDVNADGRTDNIRILSAEPRNMFERDIRQAMRRWRYEPGRPGKDLTMTIYFKLSGVSSSQD